MKLNAVHTTLPVTDLDRAKKFYREKLGLSASTEEPGGVFYEVGPTRFLVSPPAAALPASTPRWASLSMRSRARSRS
jgi:catechol 2,3-dioxygenase-like lactoylglutathione lyase family enzyme